MTILGAVMTTGKRFFALSTTAQVRALVAEDTCFQLFTAVAETLDHNKARRAITSMAFQTALMSTGKLLLTGTTTRRSRLTTFDRRIKLGYVAGAIKRLIRDELAGLAVT